MANQFLIKETMAKMKELSTSEIDALNTGTYEGVQLLGYYQKGDTPAPIIYYYVNPTTDPDPGQDDGASVIVVGTMKLIHTFETAIDVRYFGAKCDNIAIDTEAWQNAILYCKFNACKEIKFSGQTIIDKTLYFDFSGLVVSGDSVESAMIRKKGNATNIGIGVVNGIDYGSVDAVFMSVGYVGDFTFTRCKLESLNKSQYVIYLPFIYRFMLEDIYLIGGVQNLRCIQGWNCNIRKVRSRFADYGFVFEGTSLTNPQQHTSISFDNAYAEYCKIGYKLVNVAYFSGNSLSADNISDCCYWFYFSTGAINGMGTEKSSGQLIRNWASNIVVNGHQVLEIRNYSGIPFEAKSKAKFEVWSGGRNNTGLMLNGSSIRGYSEPYREGDAEYFWSDSGTLTNFLNQSHTVILTANIVGSTVGGILQQDNFDGFSRSQGSRSFSINGVAPLPYTYGYNQNRVILRFDEIVIVNTSSANAAMGSIVVPLSDVLKVFPDFNGADPYMRDYFSVKLKTNVFFSITPVSGNVVYNENAVRINASSPIITGCLIDASSNTVTFSFNENVNRPIITLSRMRNGFMNKASVNDQGMLYQSVAVSDLLDTVPSDLPDSNLDDFAKLQTGYDLLKTKFNSLCRVVENLKDKINEKLLADRNSGQQEIS